MELFEKATGKRVEVPDDQAQAAFQSGQYGFEAGTRVPVKLSDGRIGTVAAEELHKTIKTGGVLASGEEWDQAQAAKEAAAKEAEYGGGIGSLHALQQLQNTAAEGVARGLSLNMSDPITLGLAGMIGGDKVRDKLRRDMDARKEVNPITATVTEIGGALAPMVIPGGQAGAIGKGAQLAGEAGKAAELARATAEGVEAAKVAQGGIQAASAGSEAVKAATALPRALDFAGGVAERIGAKAAKAVVGDASANVLARMVEKGVATGARGAVEGALYGAGSQISEDTLGDHAVTGEKLAAAMGHGALMGGLIGGGMGAGLEGLSSGSSALMRAAAPTAKRVADEQAVKAIQYGGMSPTRLTKKAELLPGGIHGVGNEMHASGLIKPLDTVEHIAPRLDQAVGESGEKLTNILRTAGKELPQPKVGNIIADIQGEIGSKFGDMKRTNSATLNYMDNLLGDFADKFPEGTASLEALRDFRRKIDEHIGWNPVAQGSKTNPTQEALKLARAKLEGHIEGALEEGGSKLEGATLKDYQAEKLRFRRLSVANDIAQDSVTRLKKNQSVSVSEKAMGALGMLHAVATGNPLAAVGGFASAAAHHALQARGNATAAVMLDKIAELGAAAKTLKAIDARANGALDKFLEGKPSDIKPIAFETKAARDAQFEAQAKRIKKASADPVAHADSVQSSVAALVQHAPKAAAALAATSARATTYLASKLPAEPPSKSIQPQFDKHDPPAAEKEQFLRHVRAADDPYSLVDDMTHGRLTREGVDTVRTVYPSIFAELQQMAMAKATDAKRPMSYDQKIQLGLLLDVPADPTLRPEFVAAMQATFAKNHSAPSGGGGNMPTAAKRPLSGIADTTKLGRGRSDK